MLSNSDTSSSLEGLAITDRSFSARAPRCSSSVASPPSSRIMLACVSVRPLEDRVRVFPVLLERLALVGEHRRCPRCAIAAAAWSCVEKILHDAQRTWRPAPAASRSAPRSGSSCAANRRCARRAAAVWAQIPGELPSARAFQSRRSLDFLAAPISQDLDPMRECFWGEREISHGSSILFDCCRFIAKA
jgi:hypothetical protein